MREALETMLRMQHRMNTRVHPQWIEQGFAWHRAIWVECAELVDHYGYKWWKQQDHDLAQVQLEVVDIWHFGMSACFTPELPIETLAARLDVEWPRQPEPVDVLTAAERLAGIAALERRFDLPAFVTLLAASGLSFEELFRQYLGKNVLNFFRQDHGYSDGTYRKVWSGREDNEHLVELLAGVDVAMDDAEAVVYAALEQRYREAG